jgi:hypothetical protein
MGKVEHVPMPINGSRQQLGVAHVLKAGAVDADLKRLSWPAPSSFEQRNGCGPLRSHGAF